MISNVCVTPTQMYLQGTVLRIEPTETSDEEC